MSHKAEKIEDEIIVTPEMVDAGAWAILSDCGSGASCSEMAEAAYKAMEKERLKLIVNEG